MRGLLLKDLYTLKRTVSWVYLFPLVVIFICGSADIAFLSATAMLVFSLFAGFALYSIMYAEENSNWGRYVKAIPVNAKVVIAEKYVMGAILLGVALIIDVAVGMVFAQLGISVSFLASMFLLALGLGVVYIAILIPSVLKFGASKGPVVFVGCIGCLMIVPIALNKIGLMEWALAAIADPVFQLVCGLLAPLVFVAASYAVSSRVAKASLAG